MKSATSGRELRDEIYRYEWLRHTTSGFCIRHTTRDIPLPGYDRTGLGSAAKAASFFSVIRFWKLGFGGNRGDGKTLDVTSCDAIIMIPHAHLSFVRLCICYRQFTELPPIFAKITELPPISLIITDLPPSTHHVPDGISS